MNLDSLYERRAFGIKPGLDTITALLRELGDPQTSFASIHVAGTNGKGSTTNMIAALLREHGIRNVGVYTSPHLIKFNERFRIDDREIADDEMERLLGEVLAAAGKLEAAGGQAATFFEIATALCALWFRENDVKVAVVETGMGGRLDATTAFPAALAVITRIGLDHMQYLGDTLEKIAAEKAGIMTPDAPVVFAAMPDEAAAVIKARAAELGTRAVPAAVSCSVTRSGKNDGFVQTIGVETENAAFKAKLPFGASYQLENVATAVTAAEEFLSRLGARLDAKASARALGSVVWPARFQKLEDDPLVILDGGHNPDAARALVESLKAIGVKSGVRLVLGQCADKAPAEFLRILSQVVAKAWTVPMKNPRGLSPEKLAALVRGSGIREAVACGCIADGIAAARADAKAAGRPVLVCGSLFLAGEVLEGLASK